MEDNESTQGIHVPGVKALLDRDKHGNHVALVGVLAENSYIADRRLKRILSQVGQFDARDPLWTNFRRGDEEYLNIRPSPKNNGLVRKYINSLRLDSRPNWTNPTEEEINLLWWQAFSPMAQGETPSARGLLSLLLLACDVIEQIVHTGFAPIEINLSEDVSDLSSHESPALDRSEFHDYDSVCGDVRMGFPTGQELRIHLGSSRLLVNIVEVKCEDGELYYPTFLLDTNSWSLYIYFAVSSASIRETIVSKVAVAVRQMLAWARVRTSLKYYAPPITPVEEDDRFGHAMVDVFMIFLILRGWVGLDFKSATKNRTVDTVAAGDMEKSFIIPQRDWALGEAWGTSMWPYRVLPYKGLTQGVCNVIAFLGTVICDHMGLNRRKYKDGTTLCCIDDWTNPKTSYDPTFVTFLGQVPYDSTIRAYNRTNLGSVQMLKWKGVIVESMGVDDLLDRKPRKSSHRKRKRDVKEEEED